MTRSDNGGLWKLPRDRFKALSSTRCNLLESSGPQDLFRHNKPLFPIVPPVGVELRIACHRERLSESAQEVQPFTSFVGFCYLLLAPPHPPRTNRAEIPHFRASVTASRDGEKPSFRANTRSIPSVGDGRVTAAAYKVG
jgi:hypothetical protein